MNVCLMVMNETDSFVHICVFVCALISQNVYNSLFLAMYAFVFCAHTPSTWTNMNEKVWGRQSSKQTLAEVKSIKYVRQLLFFKYTHRYTRISCSPQLNIVSSVHEISPWRYQKWSHLLCMRFYWALFCCGFIISPRGLLWPFTPTPQDRGTGNRVITWLPLPQFTSLWW